MASAKEKKINNSLALLEEFRTHAYQILHLANRGLPRFDFLREAVGVFLSHSVSDSVELRTEGHGKWYICEGVRQPEFTFQIDDRPLKLEMDTDSIADLDTFMVLVAKRQIDPSSPNLTERGAFWLSNTDHTSQVHLKDMNQEKPLTVSLQNSYKSIVIIPFTIDEENDGLLVLKNRESHSFSKYDVEFHEGIATILGLAVADRRSQVALRERVKELTCLYGIARLIENPDRSVDEIMQGIVELIPPGWLYPDITSGRIKLDDRSYVTEYFREGQQKLTAPIIADGQQRGKIEVIYTEKKAELDEGPFLKEERHLIDAIAREAAHIIEHKQAYAEKAKLQEQLRHADRLATIGELAAGVAHELNEPLGNVLGFAQLARKTSEVPDSVNDDLGKIVNASLHAREIIKKLMVFARQTPSKLLKVNLNKIVNEGLYFFEARCSKAGIELVRELEKRLPVITADPAQLNQVLVNLVVNAIHAMPDGGKLIIQTYADENYLYLIIEDSGMGMDEDVKKQIFIPFFTTKDVDEGTGLGLAVVHGIVTSHRGSISVDSELGRGARFTIKLPRDE